jgi:hypothetical protein
LKITLESVISAFGKSAYEKLSNPAAVGAPEDQLRAPFEKLLIDMGTLAGMPLGAVVAVGESSLTDLKTRPDYAVSVQKALTGFVELKQPGKGSDPRNFTVLHDKQQWSRLRSIPNLIYSDGNSFSLWQNGELASEIIYLGNIATDGDGGLAAPESMLDLFSKFLQWQPIPPKTAKELAQVSARLCLLLRHEVAEQLELKSAALTALAADWRKLLFPEASDATFADGYAQAVTFGLLMARAKGIKLSQGFDRVGKELGKTNSLIGSALRLLTDNAENQATLKTSLQTLTRVLDVVDWEKVSKQKADAWLYFYEDFLDAYDKDLRKLTGSYYTPPEVVDAMVRLVDQLLVSPRFSQHGGIASPNVTIADPASGTGTYVLGIMRKIAERIAEDEGSGAVQGALTAALKRVIAFEMQLGPFAVSQLRLFAEIVTLTGAKPSAEPRMFVTDTLSNPDDDQGWIPGFLQPIAQSRKDANKIKRDEPITVVIGNPPYKEKAKGRGGWVEGENKTAEKSAPLADWMPPAEWSVGAHSKHLRNLYIYFWRWATWKVFDQDTKSNSGLVCFISVAGFLNGPGFQKMRSYMREKCDDIWIIDCSPEGHQPPVSSRIFQGVQQQICIVLASRSTSATKEKPADVHFQALPKGSRSTKFEALKLIDLHDENWRLCPAGMRDPFLPASEGEWSTYPALDDFFEYNGSGVMPGRTWVIAPDVQSLHSRWDALGKAAAGEKKEALFHPHLSAGKMGDRHSKRVVKAPLSGFPPRVSSVQDDTDPCSPPVGYGYRSFDRQWIIPDIRLINRPNPSLWAIRSERQIFMAALARTAPSSGPAVTFTGLVPDLDFYKGSFGGRIYPLWADKNGLVPNIKPLLLEHLSQVFGCEVDASSVLAYIAGLAAHPGFITKFAPDLSTPGLRIPITAERDLYWEVVELGREVVWLHTFGERMADSGKNRPKAPPKMSVSERPTITLEGAISGEPDQMPDQLSYDESTNRLLVGEGWIENVPLSVWRYEVSGKQVLVQWFSYRRKNRERPPMGDKRPPSQLSSIQPNGWLAEYTSELLNVINVLGRLVALESRQEDVLARVCSGATLSLSSLGASGALLSKALHVVDDDAPQAELFGV